MRDPNDRYQVQQVADVFVIRDLRLRAFCSLDGGENILRWPVWEDAQRWLDRCYRIWGHVPCVTDDPDDMAAKARNWREARSPKVSPWEEWSTPLWDSRFGQ